MKQKAGLTGLPIVLICALVWSVLHFGIRLFAGTRLAFDDGKENIFTQSFQLGYLPDNPPLFEWTLMAIQSVTGPGLIGFLILKYSLLMLTAVFCYLTAERLLKDKVWASLSALSIILLYQIGWNYDQVFTHSLMLTAFTAAGVWAFVRLMQMRDLSSYLIFAAIAGLGALSKYNFSGLIAALFLAALLKPETRKTVLSPFMLLTLVAMALCLLPNILYLFDNLALYKFYIGGKLGIDNASHIERIGSGLSGLMVAFISFYVPLVLVIATLFPGALKPKAKLPETADQAVLNWMGKSAVVALAIMAVGVLFFGISTVSERYMVPFLMPSFFWLMARVKAVSDARQQTKRWAIALGATALILIGLRFTEVAVAGKPFCETCQRWVPYEGLREPIIAMGADETTILIGYENDTAGNLRALFPKNNVRSLLLPFYKPPVADKTGQCLFVWSKELAGTPIPPQFARFTRTQGTQMVSVPWTHPFKTDWRETEWGISPIPPDSAFYKTYCVSE